MIVVEDVNEKIENIFSRLGLPTRVVLLEPFGSGPVEVVFPMRREFDLQRFVRAAWPQLMRYVGEEGRFLPRTILAHLAYEVFGSIDAPPGGFVSTNVLNLDRPIEGRRRIVDDRVLASFGISAPENSWDAVFLKYDVDVVIGAHRVEMTKSTAQHVVDAAMRFNQASRLIKIGAFRCAWSPSRGVGRNALRFNPIEIPDGA